MNLSFASNSLVSSTHLLDAVALNPQPLPPGPSDLHAKLGGRLSSLFEQVSLNPQPLPPSDPMAGHGGATRMIDDTCGTVTGRIPPLPDPRPNWTSGMESLLSRFSGRF